MEQSFWKPGSIVTLKQPYKPVHRDKVWKGFTHGIIVQVIGHEQANEVSHVSLHLYDPERCVIYVEGFLHGIPTYVDFHVDELIPLKDGSVIGYEPIGVQGRE